MDRLIRHARGLLAYEEPLALAGDFNVIPEPRDAARPEDWTKDALFLPETRAKFRELPALGFTDALRAISDEKGLYTFWDYQAGAWQRNNGIRIDHVLLSPQAADKLETAVVDKDMRGREKASDHVPVQRRVARRLDLSDDRAHDLARADVQRPFFEHGARFGEFDDILPGEVGGKVGDAVKQVAPRAGRRARPPPARRAAPGGTLRGSAARRASAPRARGREGSDARRRRGGDRSARRRRRPRAARPRRARRPASR